MSTRSNTAQGRNQTREVLESPGFIRGEDCQKRTYRLVHDTARRLAAAQCQLAPDGYIVEIKPPTRSLEQNARLWAMLTDVAGQVVWHGRKLSNEEWKHVFTASLKRQDVVPGLDGGFVALGLSTSKMTKGELGDLMTLIEAFGAQQGVIFHDGDAT